MNFHKNPSDELKSQIFCLCDKICLLKSSSLDYIIASNGYHQILE